MHHSLQLCINLLTVDAKIRSFSFVAREVRVASSLPAAVTVVAIILGDVLLIAVFAINDVSSIHSTLSAKAFGQISNVVNLARVSLFAIGALVRFLGTSGGRRWSLLGFLHAGGIVFGDAFIDSRINFGDPSNSRRKLDGFGF